MEIFNNSKIDNETTKSRGFHWKSSFIEKTWNANRNRESDDWPDDTENLKPM